MKALLLDGTRKGEDHNPGIKKVIGDLLKAQKWETEVVELRKLKIAPCTGCFKCWIRTPGDCIIHDDAREVTRKYIQSDVVILLTPVTFGGYSSVMKAALDRNLGIMLPYFTKINGNTHHKKRYRTYPAFIVIGTMDSHDPEVERTFNDLVSRNSTNAHAPRHAARVIIKGMGKDDTTKAIKDLLSQAGVNA